MDAPSKNLVWRRMCIPITEHGKDWRGRDCGADPSRVSNPNVWYGEHMFFFIGGALTGYLLVIGT